MARNAEKAQAMLNRWWSMKRKLRVEDTKDMERPKYASEVNTLQSCEKWRKQLLVDISRKITEVQNAGLGEFKIRQTNDEINKLIRCKAHWEARILELGGADYRLQNVKVYDAQGLEVKGNGGYKYFGAARDLPGVRELFEKERPQMPKKTQAELYREISYEYYGDEQNQGSLIFILELEENERLFEQKVLQQEVEKWVRNNPKIIEKYYQDHNGQNITLEVVQQLIDQDFEDLQEINNENLYKSFELSKNLPQIMSDQEYLIQKKQKLLQEYFGVQPEIDEDNTKQLNQYVELTDNYQKVQEDY